MPKISDWVGLSVWKFQSTWSVHFVWHWGKKKLVFPLAPDKACLGLDELLPNELSTYLERPKGLEPRKKHGGKLPTMKKRLMTQYIYIYIYELIVDPWKLACNVFKSK